jgi:hypothetical protein
MSTLAYAGTAEAGGAGPGSSGNTIPGAAAAQAPFTAGITFDSGQPINVVIPANSVLTPAQKIFVLECAAPGGVDPVTINSCDGNTAYAGGTISVNADGSIDVVNSSTNSGLPYTMYTLPNGTSLGEPSSGTPKCGMGSANECVLYIGQGGGSDTGLSQPHFFSQPFQVHPDPTDSGTLSPGDGSFPVDSAPVVTSANTSTFIKGSAGTFSVTATGWAPPTFTKTGTLPTGVTLTAVGVLSGTPTQSGSFPITITASNGVGTDATQAFTLTVSAATSAPTITSATSTTFTQGTPGTFTVTATGNPTPTFTKTGTLPTGVTLTAAGVLSGTPTQSGSFPITITASNGVLPIATQAFTLTVPIPPLVVTTSSLPSGSVGSPYSQTLVATGGQGATTWSLTSGALPPGISLGATTGVLSGSTTTVGTSSFTVTATDAASTTATAALSIIVSQSSTMPPVLSGPVVGAAPTPGGSGYWLVDSSGDVVAHGDAVDYGSMAGKHLAAPIVHVVATADGKGYWLAAADGGVFAFGDAAFVGSLGGTQLNAPVVGILATPDGKGYWLVASDGGVFAFGDATFHGSLGDAELNAPVVGVVGTADGIGYWLAAADGGVFAFGDAPFLGAATDIPEHGTIAGINVHPTVSGYWLVNGAGSLYAFGSAPPM